MKDDNDLTKSSEEAEKAVGAEMMEAIDAEIDKARKAAVGESPDADDDPGENLSQEKGGLDDDRDRDDGYSEEDEASGFSEDPPEIDESLLERAVRSGMALADARAITSADALERIVGRMEEASKRSKPADDGNSGGSEGEEDPFAGIPDLDPDAYPEDIVGAFSGLKDLVKQQSAIIKDLQSSGAGPTWIDEKIADLGSDYEDVFGKGATRNLSDRKYANARAKLERHILFAQEDAKAEGSELSQSKAFSKALESGFADKVKSVKGKSAKEAAKRRSKQVVNRPRTSTGQFGTEKDNLGGDDDRYDDAVSTVAAMFEDTD